MSDDTPKVEKPSVQEIRNPYKHLETKPTTTETKVDWTLNRTLIWLLCLPWYTAYRAIMLFLYPLTFAIRVAFPQFAADVTTRKRDIARHTLDSVEPIVGGIRVWLCR